jgi:hypothetical protein
MNSALRFEFRCGRRGKRLAALVRSRRILDLSFYETFGICGAKESVI